MTDATRHPRDAEAFEYALGTGSLDERRAFARELEHDHALASAVQHWNEYLAALADAIPPEMPSAHLLAAISTRIDAEAPSQAGNVVDLNEVVRLRRSRTVWRMIAAGSGSLAAALALWIATERFTPAQVDTGLVAVVNRSGDLPALIVRVDARSGTVQIRSVAAEVPPDRSLELWSIAPGAAPRSLGLVGPGTTQVALPGGRGSVAADMLLAVTVEPTGGSPTGLATGPIVYSGKLIPER